MQPASRATTCRTSAMLGGVMLVAASSGASARTCTVEVEDLRQIRKIAINLARDNLRLDRDKAAAAQRKINRALQGGEVSFDAGDLKGLVAKKGKPDQASVQDLVMRVQRISEACQL